MAQIIEFPEIKELNERICELKKILEDLVIERDNLICVVCKNIKTAYMLTFGSLEYSVYQSYCKYLRLRRKKDIIQAKKNREEKIILKDIEVQLDKEFQDYQKKLEEIIDDINRAMDRSKMEPLSQEEAAEIKKLYRSIVKSLHPDLNPKITDAERELFYHATEAYEKGDLGALQLIFQIVGNGEEAEKFSSSSITELKKEQERLQNLIDQIQAEINQIKSNPPYSLKKYVYDEKETSEKLRELKQELKGFQEAIRTQEEYINELLNI